MGRVQVTITSGGNTASVAMVTHELAAVLTEYGYAPREYNRFRWPMGAAQHARGVFLLATDQLDNITASNAPRDPVSLTLSDGVNSLTIDDLHMLPPTPMLVGAGQRLYAVPIVDDRYYWSATADANYNLTTLDRSRFDDATLNESDPWTYDEVVAALATDLGVSITITDAVASTAWEYQVYGRSAADALHRICVETGRALIAELDGDYRLEYLDTTTVSDILDPIEDSIYAGTVSWSDGGSGFAQTVAAPQDWLKNAVPASVEVVSPRFAPSNRYSPQTATTAASVDASSLSLAASSDVLTVWDVMPALNAATLNASELATRADLLATAYYRRFQAGGMDVILAGIQEPTVGGGLHAVEWIIDGQRGAFTRLTTDPLSPHLGFGPAPAASGSADMHAVFDVAGGVRSMHSPDISIGEINARSGSATDFPNAIDYDILIDPVADLAIAGNTSLTPSLRTLTGAVAKVNAAALTSDCIVRRGDYAGSGGAYYQTIELLAVGESLAVTECEPTEAVQSLDDDLTANRYMIDRTGRIEVDRAGNAIVDRFAGVVMSAFADRLMADRTGEVETSRVADVTTNRTLATADDITATMIASRKGDVIASHTGYVLTDRTGRN